MALDPGTLDSGVFSKEYFLQEEVCRLCWSKCATNGILLDIELIDKVRDCLNVDISEDAYYPKNICLTCLEQIEKIIEIKIFYSDLQRKLREILKNERAKITIVKNEMNDFSFEATTSNENKKSVNYSEHMKLLMNTTDFTITKSSTNQTADKINPKNKCLHCKQGFYSRYVCMNHERNFCKFKTKNSKLKVCGKKFISKAEYEAHQATHGNEMVEEDNLECISNMLHEGTVNTKTKIECDICQTTFNTKNLLKRHYLDIHGIDDDTIKCCCNKVFKTQKQLLNHVIKTGCLKNCNHDDDVCNEKIQKQKTANEETLSDCLMEDTKYLSDDSIDFVTDDFSNADTHNLELLPKDDFIEQSNDDIAPYIDTENETKDILKHKRGYCTICYEVFQSVDMLIRHRMDLHGVGMEGTFQCLGCYKECKNMNARSLHERGCESLKDGYKCVICERYLPSRRSFECHMTDHRLNKEINLPDELFKCSKCSEKFKTKDCLKNHMEDHHKSTTFVCETCGRIFTKRVYLMHHNRMHTGEKRYSCTECPYRATQRSSLNVHMRVHSGERPFACHLCPQRCVNRSNLRKHLMLKHHKVLQFQCQICSKKFAYKETLQAHVSLTHENVFPFNCQECGATFSRSSGLRRHMRKKHGATTKRTKITTKKEQNTDNNDVPISNGEEDFVSERVGIEQEGAFQIEILE